MEDVDLAKRRLKDGGQSLVFAKNMKVIFETRVEGLRGFLQAIEALKSNLQAASVADRIIGRAAALLCAYARVEAAFAITISQGGLQVLEDYGISYQCENLVPTIFNAAKTDRCPFEKLVEGVADPEEAFHKVKRFKCRV